MTRDEVKGIVMQVSALYPNWDVGNKVITVDAWTMILEDYAYEDIKSALKAYVKGSGSPFAPAVSDLTNLCTSLQELANLSEADAWSLVSKSLRNSAYNAESEFEKLPEMVQKAVGSASQLRIWALDDHFSESAVAGQFGRKYAQILNREKQIECLDENARLKLQQLRQQALSTNDQILLGVNDE